MSINFILLSVFVCLLAAQSISRSPVVCWLVDWSVRTSVLGGFLRQKKIVKFFLDLREKAAI